MPPVAEKVIARLKRKKRIRKDLKGTKERPRLSVFRSAQHIYAQVIDDRAGKTYVTASTLSPELKEKIKKSGNREAAKEVGALIAQKCLEKGIKEVVFDRSGYIYHGRVKALAVAAREKGLIF
ncbi:MAG TPA: 50S ribosomal protein L18 [Thermodesulfobacteriota bacterium]|nr:50S ribosomal protein L18 [Thermodesulfobacteriota bacterium]